MKHLICFFVCLLFFSASVLPINPATYVQAASSVLELLPYQAPDYRYQIIPTGQVPPPGFETAEFDDSSWATGAGAFGFSQNYCPIQSTVQTPWPAGTNLLVRKTLEIPSNITNVQIKLAVDNDIGAIYFNGTQLSDFIQHENCPNLDDFTFTVPQNLIQPTNTLAFYMMDRGFESYFDVRVIGEVGKTPVLIVPGTLGTELFNGNDWIWPDIGKMLLDSNDQFLSDNLILDESGNSINQIQTGDIAKEIAVINIFRGLIEDLLSFGYTPDTSLFFFPYDWRMDLDTTKDLLKTKIESIQAITGSPKVDIVAHSMGGLLTKNYIHHYGKESIDKLIFVGTPHLGAPKSAKVLLWGDRFGIPWLEEDRMRDISLNSPALHQLLPSQTYFSSSQGYIKPYRLFGSADFFDYQETKDYLINQQNKNPLMISQAEDFSSQNLQAIDLSGIDVYNIAGCKQATQTGYRLSIGNNALGSVGYSSGDGTVPLVSSSFVNIPLDHKFYVKNGDHAELPSQDGARELILNILSSNQINETDNIQYSSAFCNFKGKTLQWRSPVSVHIYSNGKHTGPLPDNSIEYGIPSVDYEIIHDKKFVFLPTDDNQSYTVTGQGEADSTFDLLISNVDNGLVGETQFFNDVGITPTSVITLPTITNTSTDNTLKLDLLGLGSSQNIPANSTLTPEEALDFTPPEAHVSFDPQTKDLKITGTDNASATEDITITDNGDTVTLTDKAGNTTVLTFKEQDRRKSLRAELVSLSYNGQVTELSKNAFLFTWLLDKHKHLTLLAQGAATQNNYAILAAYIKKFNITTLAGQDQGGKINQTLSGLHLLTVSTNQGELEWEVE